MAFREDIVDQRIPMGIVILALFLLAGVLGMAYGFYQNNQPILTAGLSVTAFCSLATLIHSVLQMRPVRAVRRRP